MLTTDVTAMTFRKPSWRDAYAQGQQPHRPICRADRSWGSVFCLLPSCDMADSCAAIVDSPPCLSAFIDCSAQCSVILVHSHICHVAPYHSVPTFCLSLYECGTWSVTRRVDWSLEKFVWTSERGGNRRTGKNTYWRALKSFIVYTRVVK